MENIQAQKHHKNKRKILILSAFLSLVVVAAVSIPLAHRHTGATSPSASSVVKSTCASTLYPELCLTAVASSDAVKSSKDVLIAVLNYTIYTVERNFFTLKKISREKGSLHDCFEMVDDTLEELHESELELEDFGFKNYSLAANKENLLTLLSAAQTNQESCLDGFSHDGARDTHRGPDARVPPRQQCDGHDKEFVRPRSGGEAQDGGEEAGGGGGGGARGVAGVVVGGGQAAAAGDDGDTGCDGGGGREWELPDVGCGCGGGTGAVVGGGFLARDITFQNTAGQSKHQALALRVNADLCAFYRCDMLAYQDTLYVHSLRSSTPNCDIHARRPNPGQRNMVTAQGRDDPNQNTGIVIQKCRIGTTSDLRPVQSSFPTYLGRPWKEYSRTVVMQSDISNVIHPAGWYEWNGNFALATLFYAEYQNTGAGAPTGNRVKWGGFRVLTSAAQAQPFTAGNFIGGGNWLRVTGFPFSLGL
ncbi:hypothetical protein SASPL_150459 [Salvia splendens]|uniref:Pectinesterase inhibitor domain-containing protein n=1 Tax=Salvia splendens TaxID=180675 RepID=A0A8X8Z1S6_SALSN|nr:hypothetical protein SASPL_150459 [Salvia splendens]